MGTVTLLSFAEDLLAGQYPAPSGGQDSGRLRNPAGSLLVTEPHAPTRRHLAPMVGWLVVLAASLSTIALTGDSVWGRGVLADGGEITATQGVLVGVPEYEATIILAFGGLGAAVFFGLAAVPWSRATRWVLTAVVAVLLVAGVVASLGVQDTTTDELVGALVISCIPPAVLLLLVWRRLRRTSATVALVAVSVGVVAHAITLVRLLGSDGSPAIGAWAMAGLLLLGLAGALLTMRSVAR